MKPQVMARVLRTARKGPRGLPTEVLGHARVDKTQTQGHGVVADTDELWRSVRSYGPGEQGEVVIPYGPVPARKLLPGADPGCSMPRRGSQLTWIGSDVLLATAAPRLCRWLLE